MSRRMDWRRARLHGRPTLDWRREFEAADRAERWLRAVERRRQERRNIAPDRTAKVADDWITAVSSAETPW
jgi:hypothetical protein